MPRHIRLASVVLLALSVLLAPTGPIADAEEADDPGPRLAGRGTLRLWYTLGFSGVDLSGQTIAAGRCSMTRFQGCLPLAGAVWTRNPATGGWDAAGVGSHSYAVAIGGETLALWEVDYRIYRVNVYARTNGDWVLQTTILPESTDTTAAHSFGAELAVDPAGDTLAIAASGDDENRGAVYVYARTGTTWSPQGKLVASDAAVDDRLGKKVVLSGGTALVRSERGTYAFVRSGATWSQQQKLTNTTGDVALDRDTAIVGIQSEDADRGAAYVYARAGATWTQQARLQAADGTAGDTFGAVGLSGDTAIIGAPGHGAYGAAYVFDRTGATWRYRTRIDGPATAPSNYPARSFGDTVLLSGSTAVVAFYDSTFSQWSNAVFASTYDLGGRTVSGGQADVDRDGKADLGVWVPNNGLWFALKSGGGQPFVNYTGGGQQIPVPGDYNGDGVMDAGVFVPNGAVWYIRLTGGGVINTTLGAVGANQVPVPADYDGDGKTDLAVRVPENGFYLVQKSAGGWLHDRIGSPQAVPVPADYDGDGKADLAVWEPATGLWFALQSSGGTFVNYAGGQGHIPVPGDYNGDSKADAGIFASNGAVWYVRLTGGGTINTSLGAVGVNQVPVPADYDADGTTDLAVWVPENGFWLIQKSTGGWLHNRIGDPTSVPIQKRPGYPGAYPYGPARAPAR